MSWDGSKGDSQTILALFSKGKGIYTQALNKANLCCIDDVQKVAAHDLTSAFFHLAGLSCCLGSRLKAQD